MLIIGTVGINTKNRAVLKAIINQGVNVLRLNFSHSDIKEFNEILQELKNIENEIHIMQDLSGRKIRVDKSLVKTLKINDKEDVIFCGEDKYQKTVEKYNPINVIPLNIKNQELISHKIKKISMKDDTMLFKIKAKDGFGIRAEMIKGGVVRADKGCNVIGIDRSWWGLTDKDKRDVDWAIEHRVDIICQSYVENENDIINLKKYILSKKEAAERMPRIYAKIESPKGVENIKYILNQVEGIIIGRGDLIPETSIMDVPIIQEKIIKSTKQAGKEIILGTHILDSMKDGRYPNLPEVESIYSNIQRGIDGFLLAGEISIGKMPIKTVRLLNNLIKRYKNER